jgi:hypothetical protein
MTIMSDGNMSEADRIRFIRWAIIQLEAAVGGMVARIGKPRCFADANCQQFDYGDKGPRVLQVLKGVRVVSGLNAAIGLLALGHVIEMGMLFRGIGRYLAEITFVEEGLENDMTPQHNEFVESFFTLELRSNEDMAAVQGLLPARRNSHRTRKIFRVVANQYSGVTHGSYQSVMEMYEGSTEHFMLAGMLNTPRIPEYRKELANYTHRALDVLGRVAYGQRLTYLFESLTTCRMALEASSAYEF